MTYDGDYAEASADYHEHLVRHHQQRAARVRARPGQVVVAKLSTWPSALNPVTRATIDGARAIAEALANGRRLGQLHPLPALLVRGLHGFCRETLHL